MRTWTLGFVALLALAAGCGTDATAPAVGHPAYSMGPGGSVIVMTTVDPAVVASAHGIVPTYVYRHVFRGFAADVSEVARAGLMRDARVKAVDPDGVATVDAVGSWGLDRIDQRALPLDQNYAPDATGAGTTVYITDTGIRYDHVEFGGRALPGFDVDGGSGADCYGHGTHVAGTVGGATYGVARASRLVAVRVFPACGGSASYGQIIAGLDWVREHAQLPAVVNMSLGGGANASMDAAVASLTSAGIVVAVSAGNSATDACTQSPARAPSALTVAATTSGDARASFSNYGGCVDLFAPGAAITSAYYTSPTATASKSGTSMSSPHVAGAAALILGVDPAATPAAVALRLAARSTKNIVSSALSANAHLLYVLSDTMAPPPPPPPRKCPRGWHKRGLC